ncbi:MAG: polysaccharide biosynthesis C-terminal domain-containing protein [Clostridia bacterium]|nr:polysaccharide biosynthesis C-terminal domain-containing protein [Clostridia bacterium]
MTRKAATAADKQELFERMPIPRALATMAVPTVISQVINLIYNMVDAFYIGRTGNSYMVAATSLTLTLVMLNTALSNIYGVGGGSLVARLLGARREDEAKKASSFTLYAAGATALCYSMLLGIFLKPILNFLGASTETLVYASQYTMLVLVAGSFPTMLSAVAAHVLRNAGYADRASLGLSIGGVLNIAFDPLFMFVLLPKGSEVIGAAVATLLSNAISCIYLLATYRKAAKTAPLSLRVKDARSISPASRKQLFSVGIPSGVLTGLFDLANVSVNMLASAHSDFVLAGMGITMKVERIPTAINLGICQGMMPIISYNYASGNKDRMAEVIRTARIWGLCIAGAAILFFQMLARPVTGLFMDTSTGEAAVATVGFATMFMKIRCLASPAQFLNYHSSYCMQAMGKGKATIIHSCVRELIFYIPFMIILDRLFGETGLAAALPVGETCGAIFALWMLKRTTAR